VKKSQDIPKGVLTTITKEDNKLRIFNISRSDYVE
jgi:hypothetical protein